MGATVWRAAVAAALLGSPLFSFCGPALASLRPFEIRSAFAEPSEHVYMLSAQMDFELPDGAKQAIQDGVAMTLEIDIAVNHARRFWADQTIATLEQHYELVYHALSDRYLVRNVNSGEQTSFATLPAAVEYISRIHRLPVLDQSLIEPDKNYEFSVRARLDVHNIPDALRFVLFWVSDWRQQTEWYTWPLKQ